MKSRFLGILSLIILSFALAACNSSSGSSSSAGGAVAAAPLKDANVFGYKADGNPILIGKTDATGSIVFNSSLSSVKFPSVVYSENGVNYESNVPFAGTLKGVMKTSGSQVYLTPANTLVAELYTNGTPLEQAEETVVSMVKYEMGLTNVNPLANPLANVNESEIVAQSLLIAMGLSESSAASLETVFGQAAEEIAKGKTFSEALKTIESSPYKAATAGTSLAELIKSKESEIVAAAAATLGSKANTAELEKNVVANTTAEHPISIKFDDLPLEATSAKDGSPYTETFTAKIYSNKVDGSGDPELHTTDTLQLVAEPTLGELTMGGTKVTAETVIPNDTELVFTVADDAIKTPATTSFTLMSKTNSNLTKSFTVTFVADDAIAIEKAELEDEGYGAFVFASSSVATIAKDSKTDLGDEALVVDLELVNSVAAADVSNNIDVRFNAPAGFTFQFDEGNGPITSGNYDVKNVVTTINNGSSTDPGKEFWAIIDGTEGLALVATKDVTPGKKTVTMQVIDNENDVIATDSKQYIFVPGGAEDNVVEIVLGDTTINADTGRVLPIHSGDVENGVFTPKTDVPGFALKLEGSFKTWNSIATNGAEAAPTTLKTNGKFYLVREGKGLFATDALGTVDTVTLGHNIDVTSQVTFENNADGKAYNVVADILTVLNYKPASATSQDTIKLVYVPNDETIAPIVTSLGGLTLDIDTTN